MAENFAEWVDRWTRLAEFQGSRIPDAPARIEQLIELWGKKPIPGTWQRRYSPQLHADRYRRGDVRAPGEGEHAMEHKILHAHFERVSCFGNRLVDGVNAMPLVCDAGGGRSNNIEADMLLLAEDETGYRLFLCEVKHNSNNAWYAAVENLRQLRLFLDSPEAQRVMYSRCSTVSLPADIPITGLVLAPSSFYASRGQKACSVGPTLKLLEHFRSRHKVDARLAVWEPDQCTITEWWPGA